MVTKKEMLEDITKLTRTILEMLDAQLSFFKNMDKAQPNYTFRGGIPEKDYDRFKGELQKYTNESLDFLDKTKEEIEKIMEKYKNLK